MPLHQRAGNTEIYYAVATTTYVGIRAPSRGTLRGLCEKRKPIVLATAGYRNNCRKRISLLSVVCLCFYFVAKIRCPGYICATARVFCFYLLELELTAKHHLAKRSHTFAKTDIVTPR